MHTAPLTTIANGKTTESTNLLTADLVTGSAPFRYCYLLANYSQHFSSFFTFILTTRIFIAFWCILNFGFISRKHKPFKKYTQIHVFSCTLTVFRFQFSYFCSLSSYLNYLSLIPVCPQHRWLIELLLFILLYRTPKYYFNKSLLLLLFLLLYSRGDLSTSVLSFLFASSIFLLHRILWNWNNIYNCTW